MKIDPLCVNPHQARQREPSQYEILLGDAMERAFGQGLWELDQLVGYLNQSGPLAPNGQTWTADSFSAELKRLSVS
ncbi:MAG: hypothetical protein EAZ37_07320 [Burkholderiales bacterium]|nr:MAG: hypothetical protein EAZ37_07320 [Burkholderiales bacterium]